MNDRTRIVMAAILALTVLVVGIGVTAAQGPTPQDAANPASSSEPGTLPMGAGVSTVEGPPGAGLDANGVAPGIAPASYNSTIRFVGSALRPRENDVNYATSGSGGCTYLTSGDFWTVWNLPLALPEGVDVSLLRMYYYDTSTVDTVGWFTKYNLYGALVNEWGVSSTGSAGNSYRDVVISPTERINYDLYSYVLNWRPMAITSSLQLCGFRIFYTSYSATFLPMITKSY